MPFDPIWGLLVGVVLLFAWEFYEAWRIEQKFRVQAQTEQNDIASILNGADHSLHEWHIGSVENTNGKMIRVYTCVRCSPHHLERREI